MPDEMIRRDTRLGTQVRAATITPASYNAEAHTVEFRAATGYEVRRWGWDGEYYERLQITPEAVDLSRVEAGQCPLLDTHSRWSVEDQLGKHVAARIESGVLILTALFAQNEKGRAVEARVAAGELSGTSVGYRITEMMLVGKRDNIPVYEVTKWVLLENSLVPVPADPDSGVRSAIEDLSPCVIIERKVSAMTLENTTPAAPAETEGQRVITPAPAAPVLPGLPQPALRADEVRMSTDDALDFMEQCRHFGISDEVARGLIRDKTPEAARAEAMRLAATAQSTRAPAQLRPGEAGRVGTDERDHFRTGLTDALLHRTNPGAHQVTELGRNFSGLTLIEIGRECLQVAGVNHRNMSKREVAYSALRMQSGSDFPAILANTTGRSLRAAYESSPQTFKRWQRRATASDFKQITRLQLSGAPALIQVPEGGEYQFGTLSESKEVYQLLKYGRRLAFPWEMMINDDLDAFSRTTTLMGRAVADFESDAAYAPLKANPTMGDSVALFHASHGNLAGSGAAPGESTVNDGFVAIGSQTSLEGRLINVTPKYIITGMQHMVAVNKLITATTPVAAADVNVFAGRLEPVIEARLNGGGSPTPWFLAADSSQIDTIEYCYLAGEEGPFIDQREGFDADGVEFKVRDVFAVKAIDWRGIYKNAGG